MILLATGCGAAPASFSPAEVAAIGALEYGEASTPIEYLPTPSYRAFRFDALADDLVTARIDSTDGSAEVWLTSTDLQVLASGDPNQRNLVRATAPSDGPLFIVFRDAEFHAAHFRVLLNGPRRGDVGVANIPP